MYREDKVTQPEQYAPNFRAWFTGRGERENKMNTNRLTVKQKHTTHSLSNMTRAVRIKENDRNNTDLVMLEQE